MPYVANARMYSVNPASRLAWKELFVWLGRQADVDLRVIDHGFPLPLAELWSRPDLACAFMCGFPFAPCPARAAPDRSARSVRSAGPRAAGLPPPPRRPGRFEISLAAGHVWRPARIHG